MRSIQNRTGVLPVPRTAVSFLAVLALVLAYVVAAVSASPTASAATVEPSGLSASTTVSLTGTDPNNAQCYDGTVTSVLSFTLPATAQVGDTFTLTLPSQLTSFPSSMSIVAATTGDTVATGTVDQTAKTVLFTLTDNFASFVGKTTKVTVSFSAKFAQCQQSGEAVDLTYTVDDQTTIGQDPNTRDTPVITPGNTHVAVPTAPSKAGWPAANQPNACRSTDTVAGCLTWDITVPMKDTDGRDGADQIRIVDTAPSTAAADGSAPWNWYCSSPRARLVLSQYVTANGTTTKTEVGRLTGSQIAVGATIPGSSATISAFTCDTSTRTLSVTIEPNGLTVGEYVIDLAWQGTPDELVGDAEQVFANSGTVYYNGTPTDVGNNFKVQSARGVADTQDTTFAVSKTSADKTDANPTGQVVLASGQTSLDRTYAVTVTNTGDFQGVSSPVIDTPAVHDGFTISTVALKNDDGTTTALTANADGSYTLSGGVLLSAGKSRTFTVVVTYTVDESKITADEWAALGTCAAAGSTSEAVSDKGLANVVAMEGDSDTEQTTNNWDCTPVTPSSPSIGIEKIDENGNDADTAKETVDLTKTNGTIGLNVPVTNTGSVDLTNIVITDELLAGSGHVTELTCDLTPYGGSRVTDDLTDGRIRIEAGSKVVLPVGKVIDCTARLTGVTAVVHSDRMTVAADGIVTGLDENGNKTTRLVPVTDHDDYFAKTTVRPTPSTPATPGTPVKPGNPVSGHGTTTSSLAHTGTDSLAAIILAAGALAGGAVLTGSRRRKDA